MSAHDIIMSRGMDQEEMKKESKKRPVVLTDSEIKAFGHAIKRVSSLAHCFSCHVLADMLTFVYPRETDLLTGYTDIAPRVQLIVGQYARFFGLNSDKDEFNFYERVAGIGGVYYRPDVAKKTRIMCLQIFALTHAPREK